MDPDPEILELAPPVREKRLDHVGFVEELDGQFAAALRPAIKSTLLRKSADRAEADYFTGKIVHASCLTIDVERFLGLYERGAMRGR